MKSVRYIVTLEVDVFDALELIKAARAQARVQNTPLQHCSTQQALQWMLDPGMGPPGTDIAHSSCEKAID
jgi:hypothetical protein